MDFDFGAEYESFGDDLKGVAYEGDHTLLVRKATAGISPKGKQKFTLTLEFAGGPHHGKTFLDSLYWSPENDTAARIFAQNLKTLGAPQDWIMATRPTPEQIAEQITGTKFEAKLKADEFNGNPQTRVTYRKTLSVETPVAGTAPSASAAAAVSLDDEVPAATAAAAAAAPAAPAAAPAQPSDNPWAA